MNRHQRRADAKLRQAALKNQERAGSTDVTGQQVAGDAAGQIDFYLNKGIELRARGQNAEAIAAFRQAVQLGPELALCHFNLGALLHECRKFDDAITSYREAIRVKPDYAEAYNNLGAALRDQGSAEEAAAAIRQAIKLKPTFALAYTNLGAALNDLGKLNEAASAYRRAIALTPDYDVAWGNLGIVLMELGRLAESREALQRAVRLAPRNIKYRRYLGELDPYVFGDTRLAALEQLSKNATQLSVDDRVELHFSWQNAGNPSSVPIFIVGMPRSGSTLVEQILASHPQIFGAGEVAYLDNAIKGIRTKFGGSMPFPEVVRSMDGSNFYDLGERYLVQLQQLHPEATHIVNKMPGNFRVAGLIHLALPNAVIIHALRNPVDTCLSCFSKMFASKMSHTYDLSELGRYFRNYQTLMAYWHSVLPADRILDVRYEDVVADIEGQARRIIAHCGLKWDERCLSFHDTDRPIRTASMVQARQPIYTSAIGRWRPFEPFLAPLITELSRTVN
jgi:tetratricopeptide (TPR) repeat protein